MRVYLAALSGFYSASKVWHAPMHRLLTSYVPNFKDESRLLMALEHACEPVDYCVDSGAHIWLAAFFKKHEKHPIKVVEDTLVRFLRAVRRLPRPPAFVVELDLQRIYGIDVVQAWRRDLWMPFERETGIPVCYVWHRVDEERRWFEMLEHDDIHYLGMSGDHTIEVPDRRRLILAAYKAAKPVHGFASVNVKWMRQVPFYSVDSTSWGVGGQVFGMVPMFDAATGKISQVKIGNSAFASDPKNAAKNVMIAKNFHPVDVETKHDKKDLGRFCTAAGDCFRQLEEWHTAYWKAKGVDWDKRLAEHGRLPIGAGGGHLAAARV